MLLELNVALDVLDGVAVTLLPTFDDNDADPDTVADDVLDIVAVAVGDSLGLCATAIGAHIDKIAMSSMTRAPWLHIRVARPSTQHATIIE